MVSRDEAVQTLRDIEETQQRSAIAYGYRKAGPLLMMWGGIWTVGYTTSELAAPAWSRLVWYALVIGGSLASCVFGAGGKRQTRPVEQWRFAGASLAAGAFLFAFFAVLRPSRSTQVGAIIPLLCALGYVWLGLWRGIRFVVAGVAIGALTLGGYFFLPTYFGFWMAAVGGGALILAGLWMRQL